MRFALGVILAVVALGAVGYFAGRLEEGLSRHERIAAGLCAGLVLALIALIFR